MMKTFAIALLAAVAFAEPEAKPKADADPYLLYGGYGYGHLGYAGYYGYPYAHRVAYYGKREADAEPKADADPYLLYGGYGHLGYAGYYGYPYAHHGLAYYEKTPANHVEVMPIYSAPAYVDYTSITEDSLTTVDVITPLTLDVEQLRWNYILSCESKANFFNI